MSRLAKSITDVVSGGDDPCRRPAHCVLKTAASMRLGDYRITCISTRCSMQREQGRPDLCSGSHLVARSPRSSSGMGLNTRGKVGFNPGLSYRGPAAGAHGDQEMHIIGTIIIGLLAGIAAKLL